MPKFGPHIPGIDDIIHDKLIQLRLTPSYVFDSKKHQERFYTTVCKNHNGKKVIFKMRTEDFEETKQYFRREILINELFTEFYNESKTLSVPLFIDGDAASVPEWMVYEFIEGSEAGDFYNGFDASNIKNFSVESLIMSMKNMHEMSAFAKGKVPLEKETSADFESAYAEYGKRLEAFFPEGEIEEAKNILAANEDILNRHSETITHGDFHPGNIIIKKDGGIAVIDWYNVHLNNYAFDIAFLSLEITDEKFRNKVLAGFMQSIVKDEAEFWQLFRLDVLRLTAQKVNVLCDALYTLNPSREDYYAKLTPRGIAKLETNLDMFKTALAGNNFLEK